MENPYSPPEGAKINDSNFLVTWAVFVVAVVDAK